MSIARRILVLAVVLALPMALMATASGAPPERDCEDPKWKDHPSCLGDLDPDPHSGVEVTVEQNLSWVHEAGHQIYYTIEVKNDSDGPVTATSTLLTEPLPEVPAKSLGIFSTIYTVAASDVPEVPAVPAVTRYVTNDVEVKDESGTRVASASVSAEATYFEPCVVNESFPIDPDRPVCILEAEPGTYKIEVTRESISRPTPAFIKVLDHSPGNVCGVIDVKWNPKKENGPFSLALTVSVPQDPIGLPDPWIWPEHECAEIPVGSQYLAIGSSGSFYVIANVYGGGGGSVTITYPSPSP